MQHDGIRGQLLTDLIENDGKVTKGWSEVCLTGIQTTCNNSEYDQEIPHSQSPSLQSITNIPAKSKKNWHSFIQQGDFESICVQQELSYVLWVIYEYSTCVKRPLKNRQNKELNDKW